MPRPMTLRPLPLLAGIAALVTAAASADVVQGVVTPAGAEAVIRDGQGNEVARVPAGSYQVWLPPGAFVAECLAPNAGKRVAVRSLGQPTTVNIDCS